MKQLNQREKMMVATAGGAVLVFVLLQFIVLPLVENRTRLQKRLATRTKAVAEMRLLHERYQMLSKHSGSLATLLAQRSTDFSLFSFLEQNAAESDVKEQIAYMKPSESTESGPFRQSLVEMKLHAISLKKLVAFLERVEAPDQLVGIDKLTIQDNTKEAGTLDVTLQMVSVDQAGSSPAK